VELVDWLLWFAVVPVGGVLIIGTAVFLWARKITLTRRRAWLVTLWLGLVFLILEMVLIYKFAYIVPD